MRVFASCLTIALLAAASVAQAQDMEITEPPADSFFVDGGYGGYRGGYHASTLQEGVRRGAADIVRSRGEFNRATSEAAINFAEARAYEIENLEKWLDAFYNLRRKAHDYRAAERRPRPTAEEMVRYAQFGKPDRLSPGELDTATGRLSWPILLRHKAFAGDRTSLERLFQKRALNDDLTAEDYLRVRETTETMKSELKDRIRRLPLQDYAMAKRFLRSLNYEAQLPVAPVLQPGLAADYTELAPLASMRR